MADRASSTFRAMSALVTVGADEAAICAPMNPVVKRHPVREALQRAGVAMLVTFDSCGGRDGRPDLDAKHKAMQEKLSTLKGAAFHSAYMAWQRRDQRRVPVLLVQRHAVPFAAVGDNADGLATR